MDPPVYDTLILSDLHLGSETSRAGDALRMLKENRFRRLILLGDIFADLNFGRLTKQHWKFLGYIRKLSNPKRQVEVVWVEGNHDHGLTEVMSHLVGVRVYQEYAWEYGGLRHLAIHGHQFDRLLAKNLRLNYLGTLLYLQLQKLDGKGKPVARLIDRLNTRWLRMSSKVASGALFHANLRKADRIFCGHTHEAMHLERDGCHYYNAGGWVDASSTYITIDAKGVQIREYQASHRLDDGEANNGDSADEFAISEDSQYQNVNI
jgi:UDP-2,3-diacylglucosamine pyrophosphatase LpxH